jgi:ferredoxin
VGQRKNLSRLARVLTLDITIKVNVREKGSASTSITTQRIIQTKKGVNVHKVLIDNDINVYQSLTRWTNCKGKQLCGTCIINIINGAPNTNQKSLDKISTMRENPESYRLSCITFAYGDLTVETFPQSMQRNGLANEGR